MNTCISLISLRFDFLRNFLLCFYWWYRAEDLFGNQILSNKLRIGLHQTCNSLRILDVNMLVYSLVPFSSWFHVTYRPITSIKLTFGIRGEKVGGGGHGIWSSSPLFMMLVFCVYWVIKWDVHVQQYRLIHVPYWAI